MDQPFFYAKFENGAVKTKGENSCLLGHKLNYAPERKSDGIFAGWSWNGQILEVENDRYGFYPLFYYSGSNRGIIQFFDY